MAFVEFAKAGDIPAGTLKDYKVQGVEIAVANIGGAYYAIARKCTHAGGDLSKGRLDGNVVICPRHGSRFDVTSGKCVGGPARKDEPSYPVKVEGGTLKVNI